jgi:hypothetical protein
MTDQPKTILGSCGLGLRLIADNTRSWEWESFPRREPKPARESLGPLRPQSTYFARPSKMLE